MTDVERKRKTIINIIYYALLITIIFFAFRYAFSTFFPIIFAFLIAALLQRPKNFLTKKTFLKKGPASVICVFALLAIGGFLIALIGVRIAEEIKGFVEYVIIQTRNVDALVNTVENTLMSAVSHLPEFLSETLQENLTTIFVQFREWLAGTNTELPDQIAGSIGGSFNLSWITTPISGVISTARQIPSIAIAVVISIVAACFMTADFDKITDFIKYQLPEKKRKDLSRAKDLLKHSLGKMGKAYLLIILVTFIEMALGLTVLRLIGIFNSNYIVIIALVTAIVDIIPVLGTGTILIPWALYSLIMGDIPMVIGLAVIYAVITVIRQIVEPKLVAGQLGLPPFLTISAMFIGLKVIGVLGMIIAPIIIIMLKLLNDEGILKLWKSPTKAKAEEARLHEEALKAKEAAKTENAENADE